MEILGELLLFLLQLLFEVLGEALLELGLEGLKAGLGRQNRNPYLAAIGYFLLGGALGALSLWVWPERVLRRGPVPGLSLLLSPLAGGAAMEAWGRFRRARGHDTTNLATFVGGAAFAFGCAIIRFQWAK